MATVPLKHSHLVFIAENVIIEQIGKGSSVFCCKHLLLISIFWLQIISEFNRTILSEYNGQLKNECHFTQHTFNLCTLQVSQGLSDLR